MELSQDVVAEIQDLVEAGEYPDLRAAGEGLVREALRNRQGAPGRPERNLPPSERPTDVDADDVNWF